jgi:hypothetical protein
MRAFANEAALDYSGIFKLVDEMTGIITKFH